MLLNGKFEVCINSLPNDIFLDWSKLKAFVDDIIDMNKKSKLVLGRVENIVGKGENTGYQYFLLFSTMFSKAFSFRLFKSCDCVMKSFGAKVL